MKYFKNIQKKRIALGLLLALVVFVGIAMPINYGAILSTSGHSVNIASAATEGDCSWTDIGCFFTKSLPAFISSIILTITAWFLGIAGYLLNTVIKFTVVDMAANLGNIDGINIAWKVFRDLANLGFIFILLDIAIRTILGVGNINTKKLLVNVIIIALLLNFSLFFTKVIIDASNIVTLGFYNKISVATVNGNPMSGGLSGAFMNKLGVTGFFDVNGTADLVKNSGDAGKMLLLGLFGGIMFMITAFVFMAAALMFIVRYVTIIFLLILSPLAFAAMALPHDDYSERWKKRLMKNVIFAPVFMILVWTTLTVMGGILSPTSAGGVDAMIKAINAPGASIGLIMNFIIVIVMIIATLVVADELGDKGTTGALKYAKKLRGRATGVLGRNTLGRAGRFADTKLANTWVGNTEIGRTIREGTTGALASSKYGSKFNLSKAEDIKKKEDAAYANRKLDMATKRADRMADRRSSKTEIRGDAMRTAQAEAITLKRNELEAHEGKVNERAIDISKARERVKQAQAELALKKTPEAQKNFDREMEAYKKIQEDKRDLDEAEKDLRAQLGGFESGSRTAVVTEKHEKDARAAFINKRLEKIRNEAERSSTTAAGATLGGIAGSVGGPVGSLTGAAIGAALGKALSKGDGPLMKAIRDTVKTTVKTSAGVAGGALIGSAAGPVGAVIGGVTGGAISYKRRNTLSKQAKKVAEVLRKGEKEKSKSDPESVLKEAAEKLGVNWGGGEEKKGGGGGGEKKDKK